MSTPPCARRSPLSCLLYTSDAADERSSVDLGGRRIIKKKKKKIFFFFQAEDGIRDAQESRGLGDVYKRQLVKRAANVDAALRAKIALIYPPLPDGYWWVRETMREDEPVSYTHLTLPTS